MLRSAYRLSVVLAFTVQTLLTPFWVVCHKPGPNGHDRLELAWDTCCKDDADDPSPCSCPASGKFPCASKLGGCDTCHDEKLEASSLRVPSGTQLLVPAPLMSLLPVLVFLPDATPVAGLGESPDHSGDPPLFLIHRAFRI